MELIWIWPVVMEKCRTPVSHWRINLNTIDTLLDSFTDFIFLPINKSCLTFSFIEIHAVQGHKNNKNYSDSNCTTPNMKCDYENLLSSFASIFDLREKLYMYMYERNRKFNTDRVDSWRRVTRRGGNRCTLCTMHDGSNGAHEGSQLLVASVASRHAAHARQCEYKVISNFCRLIFIVRNSQGCDEPVVIMSPVIFQEIRFLCVILFYLS